MSGGQYCLPQSVTESWRELELNLRTLASKLFTQYCPLMPVYWENFPFPSNYGSDRGRYMEDGMRWAVMRARKAFTPLMAMCSYAITISPKFNESAPQWADYLAKNGAYPRWLEGLRRTLIVNFSENSGRVDYILRNEPACLFLEHIPKFVEANVPVWFVWTDPTNYAGPHCAAYRLSPQAVQAAMLSPQPGPLVAAAAGLILSATYTQQIKLVHRRACLIHPMILFPQCHGLMKSACRRTLFMILSVPSTALMIDLQHQSRTLASSWVNL